MALSTNRSSGHFLARLAGATGILALLAGLVHWLAIGAAEGMYVALVGAALIALSLVRELPLLLEGIMSRRGAVGTTVLLQVLIALALLIVVNLFSYWHYQRFDLTRDRLFTLRPDLRNQLAKLQGDTTIIVYQRHTAFGQGAGSREDNYDAAAQKQIIEKVKDLAELFQDLGPRFRVEMLDIHDDDFEERLSRYRQQHPPLAKAIEETPENTIFVFATVGPKQQEYFQRLSFNDIYQLDKPASLNPKQPNLTLLDQGLDTFVSKILNVQEKKPRIGFCVAHPWLGLDGHERWHMAGLKKSLEARGFECMDIILKSGEEEPVVLTRDENRYEEIESDLAGIKERLDDADEKIRFWAEYESDFSSLPHAALETKYAYVKRRVQLLRPEGIVLAWGAPDFYSPDERKKFLGDLDEGRDYIRVPFDEGEARKYLTTVIRQKLSQWRGEVEQLETERAAKEKARQALRVENLAEQKRITDLQAKLKRVLGQFDMVVVPRLTMLNAFQGEFIPFELHELNADQVAALRDFVKSGKPLLVCEGPAYKVARTPVGPGQPEPDNKGDGVDQILRELGLEMPSQTILFDVELKELRADKGASMRLARASDPPPVPFDPAIRPALPAEYDGGKKSSHPIRASLAVAARSLSKDFKGDLRSRHPRPVYPVRPGGLEAPAEVLALSLETLFAPLSFSVGKAVGDSQIKPKRVVDEEEVFVITAEKSWNEEKPFITPKGAPRYDPDSGNKNDKGTLKEVRRGPFPIAAAVERPLPTSFFGRDETPTSRKVRIAVIGDGALFQGDSIGPMKEKMFVDTTNWLLGRDNLLARDTGKPWSFLRTTLPEQAKIILAWSMWLGLPLCFIYLGTMVMLVRRMR